MKAIAVGILEAVARGIAIPKGTWTNVMRTYY